MNRSIAAGASCLVFLAATAHASAVQVPDGCSQPSGHYRHAWYVDPVRGSPSGDGTSAHPWRTLEAVAAAGLISPPSLRVAGVALFKRPSLVQPGDIIYLFSGDHGSVRIQGAPGDARVVDQSPDFITIAAAPNQHPVIHRLELLGGSKWVFEGITFQSFSTHDKDWTKDVLVALKGPHRDIIIRKNFIWSTPQTKGWTKQDWLDKPVDGILDYSPPVGSGCVTIKSNVLRNLATGIKSQRSDKVLISDNTINYFTHDALDYGSDNMLIDGNIFVNHVDAGDGAKFHPDFMQGQPWGWGPHSVGASYRNITISNNIMIRKADPKIEAGLIQGVDAFDGDWHNIRVVNNVLLTWAFQGIAFYGVHDLEISNNIMLGDGELAASPYTGKPTILTPALSIQPQKKDEGGAVSSKVLIEQNVLSSMTADPSSQDLVVRDNTIVLDAAGKGPLELVSGGRVRWVGKPGVYDGNNTIVASLPSQAKERLRQATQLAARRVGP